MPTVKRVARADKPKARVSVARAPARADSVRVASQKPALKREKALAVARRPSAKPVTRAVRAAAVKPRAATIKIAKAKSPKLRAAPVKLAGKAKAPSPPMRAAVVKPRPTLVKIAARAKPRPVPAVAKRSAVRPMPLRMAMPRVAAPIRVSATRVVARPSFGCDDGLGRVERLICEDPWLARADRAMSTAFYRALDDADPFSRRELLRTRAVFLAFRDRCASARCVANAYADRIEEIRDITANR
jgi:hypothetical protein